MPDTTARWLGAALTLIVSVATLWLAATGQLNLYIHPRYFVFTAIAAAAACLLTVWALVRRPRPDDEHETPRPSPRGRRTMTTVSSVTTLVVAAVLILVVPPATLSSATVQQRSLNSGGAVDAAATSSLAESSASDLSRLSVKDWASLLSQTSDPTFYDGKSAELSGFVSPDPSDPDIFYVTRFFVTCCAVDAQPVGVPVYAPGWSDTFEVDSWVSVSGGFEANTSAASTEAIVLFPTALTPIGQPDDPYVY